MELCMTRFERHTFRLTGCLILLSSAFGGCQPPDEKTRQSASKDDSAESRHGYSVMIDRNSSNTPSYGSARTTRLDDVQSPRALAFEMVGFGRSTAGGMDARAAGTQAAIIDALGRALVEARRTRAQSTSDFSAKFGRRLTITHRTKGEGSEIEVVLSNRGQDFTLVVRDGVLQTAPGDVKLVKRIFEETNGEFALLSADAVSASRDRYEARVACYQAAAAHDTRLAGELKTPPGETP
jgi:hypothetical protein